jgi:hypothetical protein
MTAAAWGRRPSELKSGASTCFYDKSIELNGVARLDMHRCLTSGHIVGWVHVFMGRGSLPGSCEKVVGPQQNNIQL